jgi:hypothetical protein
MKRLIPAAAIVAALLAVTLSTTGSAAPSRAQTFTLVTRDAEGNFNVVDNAPRAERPIFRGGRLSAGDFFVFHQPVLLKGRRVGAVDVQCTAARGGKSFERARFACQGAYGLKRGTITVQAVFKGGADVVRIAITGGTGKYEGASGSIRSISGENRSRDVFHLITG